jgi:hypothetical protein
MSTTAKSLTPPGGAVRPTRDLDAFLVILRRGFNFSAGNTSEWTFEDWEAAVDALDDDPGCGVAPALGPDCLDPDKAPKGDSRFEGHGIWTLFALAYMRGRGAFARGISKTARPFRSMQIRDVNVPTGVGDTLDMHFRNGFDDALADAVSGGDRTPDWVRTALRGPLERSRRERAKAHHPQGRS